MSDHNHECPKCNGFYECDRNDCKEDDLCLECEIINRDATIAALESKLKSSEEIRIAEKKILITEIEKNAALRAEVKRLNRQLEAWQRKSPFDTHIASYEVAIANLRARLESAEKERDELRKVVWHLEYMVLYDSLLHGGSYWYLSKKKAEENNLDIAKLQREMGK